MFLHLGQDYVINEKDIIGIFDIDTVSSPITKRYFKECERSNRVITVSDDLPKSVVVTQTDLGPMCYISQLSAATLYKRLSAITEL